MAGTVDGGRDRGSSEPRELKMPDLALLGGPPVRTRPFPPWPQFGRPEEQLLLTALRSGHWGRTTGGLNEEFERRFAAYQQAAYAVTCVNGTVALELALRAAGIGPGAKLSLPSSPSLPTPTPPCNPVPFPSL